jgi:alkanesulfonate monooxygenase SsuD/methylene tetrahydromethanopterin reductase-like flavin-dependent oxidoreductase (luciferase family)
VLADTEAKAQEIGRSYYFGGGHASFSHLAYSMPPGYTSATGVERIASHQKGPLTGRPPKAPLEPEARRAKAYETYMKSQGNNEMLVGTPDSVIPRLKTILEITRPGILILSAPQGNTSTEDRRRSMQLIAECVLPEIREHAKKIGLVDAFERQPGSVPLRAGEARVSVVDRGALEQLPQPFVPSV